MKRFIVLFFISCFSITTVLCGPPVIFSEVDTTKHAKKVMKNFKKTPQYDKNKNYSIFCVYICLPSASPSEFTSSETFLANIKFANEPKPTYFRECWIYDEANKVVALTEFSSTNIRNIYNGKEYEDMLSYYQSNDIDYLFGMFMAKTGAYFACKDSKVFILCDDGVWKLFDDVITDIKAGTISKDCKWHYY